LNNNNNNTMRTTKRITPPKAPRPKPRNREHRDDETWHRRDQRALSAVYNAGSLLAAQAKAASVNRKTPFAQKSMDHLDQLAISPDMNREFMRAQHREYQRGTGAPIYDFPFIGCKVLNLIASSSTVSWNGALFALLSTCTQGSADNQRTGDVIRVIGLDVHMRFSKGSAAAPGSDSEYQCKISYTPLGSMPINTIYQDTGTAFSGCSAADWDYRAAIKDYFHVFDTVDTYHPLRVHKAKIRCNELTNFDQGSTTVTTGYWTLSAISGEDPAAPTQTPATYAVIQMYYQDV